MSKAKDAAGTAANAAQVVTGANEAARASHAYRHLTPTYTAAAKAIKREAADPTNPLNNYINSRQMSAAQNSVGQRVVDVLRSPTVRGLGLAGEVAGAVGAIDSIRRRGADVTNVGDLASSSALLAGAAGVLGRANPYTAAAATGWQAGRLIDETTLNDAQRDWTGEKMNAAVRGAGNLVGQDWGVDDTAHKALKRRSE